MDRQLCRGEVLCEPVRSAAHGGDTDATHAHAAPVVLPRRRLVCVGVRQWPGYGLKVPTEGERDGGRRRGEAERAGRVVARGRGRLGEVGGRGVGVEQGDGGRGVLCALEVLDARLEALDVLAHELGARLALAVVVLASLGLLCARTLLTRRLGAVTFLEERGRDGERGGAQIGGDSLVHIPSCASCSGGMPCLGGRVHDVRDRARWEKRTSLESAGAGAGAG